jgi:hypothetical protein
MEYFEAINELYSIHFQELRGKTYNFRCNICWARFKINSGAYRHVEKFHKKEVLEIINKQGRM